MEAEASRSSTSLRPRSSAGGKVPKQDGSGSSSTGKGAQCLEDSRSGLGAV